MDGCYSLFNFMSNNWKTVNIPTCLKSKAQIQTILYLRNSKTTILAIIIRIINEK